jgi:hypothetical protein
MLGDRFRLAVAAGMVACRSELHVDRGAHSGVPYARAGLVYRRRTFSLFCRPWPSSLTGHAVAVEIPDRGPPEIVRNASDAARSNGPVLRLVKLAVAGDGQIEGRASRAPMARLVGEPPVGPLLVPQRNQRIDARRAASRKPTGNQRGQAENRRRRDKNRGVARRQSEQDTSSEAA